MIGIGAILVIIGVALAAWQWAAVLMFLCGVVPVVLFLLGFLFLLIGYSQIKAKRFYRNNVTSPDGETR